MARVHELSPDLLDALWSDHDEATLSDEGLLLDTTSGEQPAMPELPFFFQLKGGGRLDPDTGATLEDEEGEFRVNRGGATFEFVLQFDDLRPWQMIFDSRDDGGRGVTLMLTDRGTLRFAIYGALVALPGATWLGGLTESAWETDPGHIEAGRRHYFAFLLDGGPKTVLVVRDGVLEDGGDHRQYGWGRFHPNLKDPNGAANARIAPDMNGSVERFRLYDRALKVNHAARHTRFFECGNV